MSASPALEHLLNAVGLRHHGRGGGENGNRLEPVVNGLGPGLGARHELAVVGLHAPARDEDAHVGSVVAIVASRIDTEIEGFVLTGDQRTIYRLAPKGDLAPF